MNAVLTSVTEAPAASEEALIDEYVTQLTQLSPNGRLELIARLSQTLKSMATTESASRITALPAFVGAWAADPEADKMEAAILDSRYFEAKPELEKWS